MALGWEVQQAGHSQAEAARTSGCIHPALSVPSTPEAGRYCLLTWSICSLLKLMASVHKAFSMCQAAIQQSLHSFYSEAWNNLRGKHLYL